MDVRERIVADARTWIGTPFHHAAAVKGVGADCAGFLHGVFGELMGLRPFPHGYAPDWCAHNESTMFLDWIGSYVVEVQRPVPAGLVVAKYGLSYSHGGLVTFDNTVIHAFGRNNQGRVRETNFRRFHRGNHVRYFEPKWPNS